MKLEPGLIGLRNAKVIPNRTPIETSGSGVESGGPRASEWITSPHCTRISNAFKNVPGSQRFNLELALALREAKLHLSN